MRIDEDARSGAMRMDCTLEGTVEAGETGSPAGIDRIVGWTRIGMRTADGLSRLPAGAPGASPLGRC
jgi:hypothetical protein